MSAIETELAPAPPAHTFPVALASFCTPAVSVTSILRVSQQSISPQSSIEAEHVQRNLSPSHDRRSTIAKFHAGCVMGLDSHTASSFSGTRKSARNALHRSHTTRTSLGRLVETGWAFSDDQRLDDFVSVQLLPRLRICLTGPFASPQSWLTARVYVASALRSTTLVGTILGVAVQRSA